jgi:diguanylate cyclase (GGDEF)-like protein
MLKSLERRIAALLLIVLLLVQLAGFIVIQNAISRNGRAVIAEELVVGERVFRRLLKQNAEMLTQGAQLLAKDYGFLSAIASGDDETITSALTNHGARIGASFTIMVNFDRSIRADVTRAPSENGKRRILQLVNAAERDGSAVGTAIIENGPFQIVVVPVKAPVVIGWVVMAFPMDQRLAADMLALSSLETSFLVRSGQGAWAASATTLAPDAIATVTAALNSQNAPKNSAIEVSMNGDPYAGLQSELANDNTRTAIVVLQRSVSAAIAPYRELQMTLLILTAASILIAALVSMITARRITGPLRELTNTARRLGGGDYNGPIPTGGGEEIAELSRAFGVMRTGIAKREAEIHKLAYWDSLTDLPNRAHFARTLHHAISSAGTCHILMMDLDRFKNVNDVLGQSFGDALLRSVAQRLISSSGADPANIARLGGDEFAILLLDVTLDEAQEVAIRVLKALEMPIVLDNQAVDLGAGIGIAGYPQHGSDAESVLGRAEVAMHVAKRSGNQAAVYDAATDESSQQSLSLLSDLRRAVDRNELKLYVQPKLSLDKGEVTGLEALVRWVHPERGMIFPDQFIPFSEQTGFIRAITLWMLDRTAALCSTLALEGLYPKLSVNISARDLMDQELSAKFSEILFRHKVSAASFCLEITESAIMDDPVRAQNTLESLHALGAELSIDDFGTGYSSLAYLKQLPVDELKIDKSFVMNMEHDADNAKIVRSTIDLGHNLGLRVVAEGIESEQAWDLLSQMGCDSGQGYLMSRPIPANEFGAWSRRWASNDATRRRPASDAPPVIGRVAAMEIGEDA